MSNICKTVSLRTRKIKDGHMLSYYLDYYPGYRDESTMKVIRHESLGIYIYAKPKNQMEQKYNINLTARAEAIRCRRFEAIVNERYDFFDKEKMKGDFLAYFKKLADKKNSKWQHVYMHFRTFTQGKCTFGEINVDLCNRFREYLLTVPQGLHKNRKLHINSAANYWSTFRASIHTAYRDRKIKENPNGFLERIETIPTDKEHLSQDEVIRLASTPCSAPALKRAFLFSCLTALRKSDIKKLTWEEIQPYGSDGVMYVTTRMQPNITIHLNFPFNNGKRKNANPIKSNPKKANPSPKANISSTEIMLSLDKILAINVFPNELFDSLDTL